MALVYCQEEYYMIYNNKCMLQIDAGHNSPSTIFWEERTHNWGLPMLVVSLTTTEEALLLDHKYQSYTESNSKIQIIIQLIEFLYAYLLKKR